MATRGHTGRDEWAPGSLELEENFRRVRRLFPIEPGLVHLNTAAIGSVPEPVLAELGTADLDYARDPRDPYLDTLLPDVRAALASSYGCDPDELAVVQSGTDGLAKIFGGLELSSGDEIITTTHECFTVMAPLSQLRDRNGIVIKRVTPPVGPDQSAEQIVDLFAATITSRTKVLAFPAVSLTVGTTFPTRMLAELAMAHGLVSVVDGGLLPGLADLNLHELGVDFLSAPGSKYQCGPLGTGLLYARNKVLPGHNPLPPPPFWPMISLGYPTEGGLPRRTTIERTAHDIGDYLQQTDTADLSRGRALAVACELWDRIGRGNIWRYVTGLRDRVSARIATEWGPASVFSPLHDERLRSGIVTFQPFRDPADAVDPVLFARLERRLRAEHGIAAQVVGFPVRDRDLSAFAIRLAPHLYVSVDELDYAVDALVRTVAAVERR